MLRNDHPPRLTFLGDTQSKGGRGGGWRFDATDLTGCLSTTYFFVFGFLDIA